MLEYQPKREQLSAFETGRSFDTQYHLVSVGNERIDAELRVCHDRLTSTQDTPGAALRLHSSLLPLDWTCWAKSVAGSSPWVRV
jgi:hypothetical protein